FGDAATENWLNINIELHGHPLRDNPLASHGYVTDYDRVDEIRVRGFMDGEYLDFVLEGVKLGDVLRTASDESIWGEERRRRLRSLGEASSTASDSAAAVVQGPDRGPSVSRPCNDPPCPPAASTPPCADPPCGPGGPPPPLTRPTVELVRPKVGGVDIDPRPTARRSRLAARRDSLLWNAASADTQAQRARRK